MKKYILIITLIIGSLFILSAEEREYTLTWGWGNETESLAISSHGLASLTFDSLSYPIEMINIPWLRVSARVANTAVQGAFGTWIFMTLVHEGSHLQTINQYGGSGKIVPEFLSGHYEIDITYNQVSALERAMICSSGPELSTLLGQKYIEEMYSGKPSPFYSFTFMISSKLIDNWIYSMKCYQILDDPNGWVEERTYAGKPSPLKYDMIGYTLSLAENYGYYSWIPQDSQWLYEPVNINDYINPFFEDQMERIVTAYTLAALLDPALYLGIAGLYKYIVKGEITSEVPMFHFGDFNFMPSVQAYMGHKGAENWWYLYMNVGEIPFHTYFRHGGNLHESIYGWGAEINNIPLGDFGALGGRIDVWTDGGFLIELNNSWSFEQISSTIFATAGYKSEGYIPGFTEDDQLFFTLGWKQGIDWKSN